MRKVEIDRKTKEVKICNSYDSAINYCGEVIEYYSNPNIYIEEGIQYEVSSGSITYADDIYLVPECSYLVEESEELKQIIEILGGQKEMYTLEGNFFTNGEELFIGFISDVGMFGYESDLRFPIIFKCSINSDIFEYVGCVFYKDVHFYEDLEVIKLN